MQNIIYLPGWLNDAKCLEGIAELVGGDYSLLNLPSDKVRTVPEMARFVSENIKQQAWIVGHSFGGKIAIATAVLYPEKVSGIIIVSGSNRGRLIFRLLKPAIKLAKWMGFSGTRFQAADYKNSSLVLKKVMQKTLAFNIFPFARRVKCPATFVYGGYDKVTPPKLGKKLARMANGKFYELAGFNHNTIIESGAYQVAAIIKSALQ